MPRWSMIRWWWERRSCAWSNPAASIVSRRHRRSLTQSSLYLGDQGVRVEGGAHFPVVVEIDIDIAGGALGCRLIAGPLGLPAFAAGRPGCDVIGPAFQRRVVVAAGIEFLRAMQAAIDEVAGDIHQQRPLHRVRHHQPDAMLA